jgi:hypothetical protein
MSIASPSIPVLECGPYPSNHCTVERWLPITALNKVVRLKKVNLMDKDEAMNKSMVEISSLLNRIID